MRIGLVGTGDAASQHARALKQLHGDNLRWTATCGRDPKKHADFRFKHSAASIGAASFPNLTDLLSSRTCDAVILATPDDIHVDQVVQVVQSGLAVLVEKPLALTEENGARALREATKNNVYLTVGYHLRHHNAHREMLWRRPELGAVRSIFMKWAWPDPNVNGWRSEGQGRRCSMSALGVHCIDLAMFLTENVDARNVNLLRDPVMGVDTSCELTFRLAKTMVHVSTSVKHRALSRVIMTCDEGEIEALGTLGARGGGELLLRPADKWHAHPESLSFLQLNPYVLQLLHFIERAPHGFQSDESLLANLKLVDRAWEL